MSFVDIGILLILVIPALVGVLYGFLNIILSIVAWIISLGIAVKLKDYFSPMLAPYIETDIVRDALAFIGLFMLSLMILTAIGYFMVKLLGRTGLTAADRILGLLFGAGLGGSIVAVLIFLAGFTDMSRAAWWQQSLLISPFERTAIWARQYLPENVARYHQYGDRNPVNN